MVRNLLSWRTPANGAGDPSGQSGTNPRNAAPVAPGDGEKKLEVVDANAAPSLYSVADPAAVTTSATCVHTRTVQKAPGGVQVLSGKKWTDTELVLVPVICAASRRA